MYQQGGRGDANQRTNDGSAGNKSAWQKAAKGGKTEQGGKQGGGRGGGQQRGGRQQQSSLHILSMQNVPRDSPMQTAPPGSGPKQNGSSRNNLQPSPFQSNNAAPQNIPLTAPWQNGHLQNSPQRGGPPDPVPPQSSHPHNSLFQDARQPYSSQQGAPKGTAARSDIPEIPDIPQDIQSQQAAWILIIAHLYPNHNWDKVTATFNRIWYGPEIIFHMIYRVRIEKPVDAKGITSEEAKALFADHKLWNNVEHTTRMKALLASHGFVCTFPNPRAPGQPYQWLVGFQCIKDKIEDAWCRAT